MDSKTFSDYVAHITAAGYTSTLLALGHELGLFELMMKEKRSMTSHEIADMSRMKEIYVREWLAGVVTGQFVAYDPEAQSYYIPEIHHDSLRTLAAWAGGVFATGARTNAVKKCFMKDGPDGLTLDDDDAYWTWFGNWRKLTSQTYVENDIVPRLRESGVTSKLESGVNVLDACCGSGDLTFALASLFPNSTFTGVDISEKALNMAIEQTKACELKNLNFMKADVNILSKELTNKFDVVLLLETLHDLPDPGRTMKELDKVLNPGGVFVCTDFLASTSLKDDIGDLRISSHYAISLHHCVPSKLRLNPNKESEKTWDRTDMERVLKSAFYITNNFDLPNHIIMTVCKKI